MPTTMTSLSSSTSLAGAPLSALLDGVLVVRYSLVGGVAVFECCGEPAYSGQIDLPPETWRAWIEKGIDLVVEPSAPSPTLGLRVTDIHGRALRTASGEVQPVTATSRLSVHLLFAGDTGMSFKIALDGAGAVFVDLGDLTTSLRPPPPKLPPDPPPPT